jgi:uncharacterized membrane protein
VTRFRNTFALLRGQLWILPAFITAGAAVLAYVLLRNGADLFQANRDVWWLYSGDAGTARDLLSSLLSGLMTMTSLIVSVTFVILTLAANQLGPRLITIFMADRQIQAVLGLFLGTILYVVIVFRTLDDALGSEGVPHVAVTVASALTIACLLALLFYIHKIARSIIADNVVEAVAKGLRHDVRQILAEEGSSRTPGAVALPPASQSIALARSGYIQVVDYDALVRIARREEAVLTVQVRASHHVLRRGDHVLVHGSRRLREETEDEIRGAFVVAGERTPAQDLEYGIRQLVEIALRALSPGINDTFTAAAVIDGLGGAFEEIFSRSLQPKVLQDDEGRVRVIADRSDERGLVDAAFDPIRQAGRAHPAILIRIADTLAQLAPTLDREHARRAVLQQLEKVAETARSAELPAADRQDTLARVERAKAAVIGREPAGRM